jgi:hypothetical protein
MIAAWLLFVLWFESSGTLGRQVNLLQTAAAGPPLRLTLSGVIEDPAVQIYEISARVNEQQAAHSTVRASEAVRPVTLRLPFLLASRPRKVLNVRVAARDEHGCIWYGGQLLVVTDSIPEPGKELSVHVAMKQLPTALCL